MLPECSPSPYGSHPLFENSFPGRCCGQPTVIPVERQPRCISAGVSFSFSSLLFKVTCNRLSTAIPPPLSRREFVRIDVQKMHRQAACWKTCSHHFPANRAKTSLQSRGDAPICSALMAMVANFLYLRKEAVLPGYLVVYVSLPMPALASTRTFVLHERSHTCSGSVWRTRVPHAPAARHKQAALPSACVCQPPPRQG